jgi:SAM-dependent methyltransferase
VAKVTGDSRLQSDVLEDLSDARRYRRWLADLARPHLGDHPVEIGSGNGDYALEWVSSVTTFTATEADEDRFESLRERFADHPVIRTRWLMLGDTSGQTGSARPADAPERGYSAAVAYNVFEHIPDDTAAVRDLAGMVAPGGAVVLVVPAFPSAMSRFDLAIGHQRRYTVASARALLRDAGLVAEAVRYVNPIGLISWYVAVKALGMAPRNGAMLRLYDRTIVPLARYSDGRLPMPFGQSVFAVGRVPVGPAVTP